ncbi:branched-chain amino acid ABC transporter permease [Chelatococcus asaccharovorans]|uniref:Amino acid/amide ABC transporter membrane protein 1 (HAAT family) n=1 Tax=Chelatococcus asaccharovorans TaxID=28210 RepID=A0A2V3UIW7_9HYPH|nr:branched-chain amino acid ABC transporter permease [Chelatococcus asaccharovorans]MBS7706630.1 branched-chain amino acid ABC transporter permease [Chelatococcus asaccharovorans]PXW64720.1 amino acid/amide ABC transporter membrane protein 1 (HAAT family) [Chelatococcus asaccharovorans]CAH1663598.1 Amino acid/amide ABC transporter membrane protein 1 (HAAT family) [Chelatococcus asaccharovorans]CAH1682729.1 Amino acid/amide ABC transporter membrane protein 1 (HAAT family) [Chelatococcus asaccha
MFWINGLLNSLAFGAILFLLAVGFSLIFGLMRVANLAHGAIFMLGGYIATSMIGFGFLAAVLAAALACAAFGGLVERSLIRRLAGRELAQVLGTLGLAFIIADQCLLVWSGDPIAQPAPALLRGTVEVAGVVFPAYRLALIAIAAIALAAIWLLVERTTLGARIRAAVDDREMARAMGIPVSRLFTTVFCLGAGLAGMGGALAAPVMSVYPGLDAEMLPLALLVVILGGIGSLSGAFVGSLLIGLIYTFGQMLLPDLAYVILFLPMVVVLAARPQGLFGRHMA